MFQRIWNLVMGKCDDGEAPMVFYRGYRITKNPYGYLAEPLIFSHQDYDGPGDCRCGTAATIEAAKREIDEIEDDQ